MRNIPNYAIICAVLLLTGCAQMFTAKTQASYTAPNGAVVEYSSDKEQQNLMFDLDPATGKIHVQVDKAGTPDAVIAAVAQQITQINKILETLAPMMAEAAKVAATKTP